MNKQFKDKIVGCGTTPKFNNGMLFCVCVDTISVAIEDCSRKELALECSERQEQMPEEDLIEIDFLNNLYEYENWLVQRQNETIREAEADEK
jgi:hypothetical protein